MNKLFKYIANIIYPKIRINRTILVVIFILSSFMLSQTRAQIFGSVNYDISLIAGSESAKCYDQFLKWTDTFRKQNLPVTVYNFEIYMRDGLQNVLMGRIQEGIGAIGIVAMEGNKEAWFLLGSIYSYGLGVTRNTYIGDIFFRFADMSNLYNAAEIAQLDRSTFISAMERGVADMSRSIDAKIMSLNEMNSMNSYPNKNSRVTNNDNKQICPYCRGTGYFIEQSSTPGTMIGNTPYYNSQGSKCAICGKSNKHWHIECKHP